jgi:hypothetical protein
VLNGKRGLPFSAQSTCYPGSVPGRLLTPAQPFFFIQTPKEVWMIWESDHMVRRIYLTDQLLRDPHGSASRSVIMKVATPGGRYDRASGPQQFSRLVPHAA